jgi:hypothetical protein
MFRKGKGIFDMVWTKPLRQTAQYWHTGVRSGVLSCEEVKYEVLLETLGGEDLLSLMIGARNFEPYYNSNSTGLQFIFGEPGLEVQLVPMAIGSSATSSFYTADADAYYQLGITVARPQHTVSDLLRPAWNQIVIDDLAKLIPTFEKVAKVALSFG